MDNSHRAAEIFNKYASEYNEKFKDVSMYHQSFDVFCDAIQKQNAEVLELACGPGNITKYLLHKRHDLKILGTDLAPRMLELAQAINPTSQFQLLDSREILKLGKSFDAIMCGFCLPYLTKEEAIQLIADASQVLNENGVIYISTMEYDNANSGLRAGSKGDLIFMNFHEEQYLSNSLKQCGFEMLFLQRKQYPASDGSQTTDLLIVAKKLGL
jgi:ubiquinone/menaquinone biosynthesis C-methylase UbiE